jgi:Transposase domain (DUF772)
MCENVGARETRKIVFSIVFSQQWSPAFSFFKLMYSRRISTRKYARVREQTHLAAQLDKLYADLLDRWPAILAEVGNGLVIGNEPARQPHQGGLFSYIAPDSRVPANHPLRKIRELVRDVLGELTRSLGRLYASEGRPSIPPEQLLSALLLQVFYGIRSERKLMEQLDYNLLYRWFVGADFHGQRHCAQPQFRRFHTAKTQRRHWPSDAAGESAAVAGNRRVRQRRSCQPSLSLSAVDSV